MFLSELIPNTNVLSPIMASFSNNSDHLGGWGLLLFAGVTISYCTVFCFLDKALDKYTKEMDDRHRGR